MEPERELGTIVSADSEGRSGLIRLDDMKEGGRPVAFIEHRPIEWRKGQRVSLFLTGDRRYAWGLKEA